jgi:hypothetical protein
MKKISFKLVAALMCLSMSLPVQAQLCNADNCDSCNNQVYYDNTAPKCCDAPPCAPACEPCFAPTCCTPKRKLNISPAVWGAIGGALLGAAAGAGTGYAAGHNNRRHCDDCFVPSRPSNFSCDSVSCYKTVEGSVLTFMEDRTQVYHG